MGSVFAKDHVVVREDVVDELRSVERRLALFAMSMLEISWTGSDADGATIQEEAQRLGLVEETTFDPAIHHDQSGASEAGDTYFVIAADVRGILDGTRLAKGQSET